MKPKLLYAVLTLLAAHLATAQVLYSENFDNLTVGNIGTDPTGQTAGQGGWHTRSYDQSNDYFKIVAEPGRGNVMELITPQSQYIDHNALQKRGIDVLWNTRISGNDILKIEYDVFMGPYVNGGAYAFYMLINNIDYFTGYQPYNNVHVIEIPYQVNLGKLRPFVNSDPDPNFYYISTQQIPVLNNTWIRLVVYIDYPNQKMYFSLPSIGVLMVHDAPNVISPVKSLLFIAATGGLTPSFLSFYKFDNIIISAVDTVPLSTQNFISSKFNVFPNPASNVVTITNSENIGIEEITVYDINGKIVKSQKGKTENEIQLNVSNLSSGTYLLHIKTKEGIAIKKLVKN